MRSAASAGAAVELVPGSKYVSFEQLQHSLDPHGYHPVVVDENCLTDELAREAILDAFHNPEDWTKHLTRQERTQLKNDLNEIDKKPRNPHIYSDGERAIRREKRAEFARLGLFRAFARRRFADGHAFWYGDSIPFARSGKPNQAARIYRD